MLPDENLAVFMPTYMSSVDGSLDGSLAVDNDTNPDVSGGSCSQTQAQNDPWWLLQLDEEIVIDYIVIHNAGGGSGETLLLEWGTI